MIRTEARPLRCGVIGVGNMARRRFFPALASIDGLELTAVGTRDPARLSLERRLYPHRPLALTYEDFLRRGRDLVDAVYISLPNDMHVPWILRCADAGLHVLCEKPLAGARDDALRCVDACASRDLLLAEVSAPRFDPRLARVAEIIASGVLGRVHLLESWLMFPLENPANIRLSPDRMGGALLDIGWYGIDLARFVFHDAPVSVTARALWGATSRVDELTSIALLFTGGRMSNIVVSTHLRRKNECRICGVEGTVVVPDAFVPNELVATEVIVDGPGREHRVEAFPPFSPLRQQIVEFAEALWTGHPGRLALEAIVENAAVLESARRSMQEGPRMELQW